MNDIDKDIQTLRDMAKMARKGPVRAKILTAIEKLEQKKVTS